MQAIEFMSKPDGASIESAGSPSGGARGDRAGVLARGLQMLQTARYFRAEQIARRLTSAVGRRLTRNRPVQRFGRPACDRDIRLSDGLTRISERCWSVRRGDTGTDERAAGIRAGRWMFLGQEQPLGLPLDWRSSQLAKMPRLWQFHLHYHEWLVDVAVGADAGGVEPWDHVLQWLGSFGECSEAEAGDAWHPYCISRRVPAWLAVWGRAPPPREHCDEIVRSIAAQMAYLEHRLELDLGGNHLLENARALILTGAALRNTDGDRWLERGMRIVDDELPRQVLPHGEHFERSPMYHVEMTHALEDSRDATADLRPEFSASCGEVVGRMRGFTQAILHPDGQIPLLADSALTADSRPAAGRPEPSLSAQGDRVGDYWAWRDRGDFLLFDAGPVGPDHLPAHAHADLLNIEASCDGVRFVVDSGVHDYEDGAMRQYCRSTAAHNVLDVDGENQCDVYLRFRMGRRGWPSPLLCGTGNGVAWASATHDAYRHLGVERVGRWIGCCAGGDWLIADWAAGRERRHTLINRMHLHPEVQVRHESPTLLLLERNGVRRWLRALGSGRMQVVRGWYCPQFGERIANPVVELRTQAAPPAVLGWEFSREPSAVSPTLSVHGGALHVLNWGPSGGIRQLIRLW